MLKGKKILVTGATGRVARAICRSLVGTNDVWGAARFTEPGSREELERMGAKPITWTLGDDDYSDMPADFDHVIHAAWSIFPVKDNYDEAIRVNAESTGLLMAHLRKTKSFLFISTVHVYALADPAVPSKESDALGLHCNYAPSYGIAKVAGEAVLRTLARLYNIPTTIARLGMNYGEDSPGGPDNALRQMLAGGEMEVPARGQSIICPTYNGDVVDQVEALLKAASVPATVVNWTGDENVDARDLFDFMAKAAGLSPTYVEKPNATPMAGAADPTKRIAITGPTRHGWKHNLLKSLRANFPDVTFKDVS